MATSKASANSNKRKKTTDMPDSPPKRVTRSRAKGMEVPEQEPIKTTKIKTASAKAAATKPASAKPATTKSTASKPALKAKEQVKPATTKKRTTRANDAPDHGVTDQPMLEVSKQDDQAQVNTRGRRKKVTEQENVVTEIMPASKTRAQMEPTNTDQVIETAPATKAKPAATRATRATASTLSKTEKEKPAAKITKKTTRGTTASNTAGRVATSGITKAPISRKKVTFQEIPEQDKENEPIIEPKKSGISAKPIRKPAATKTTARKGKAAPVEEAEKKINVEKPKPLSPKKILQVAKSFSSEDELAAEKTPVKLLNQSPRKAPGSVFKETNDTTLITALSASPTRAPVACSLTASPPRRPPPSPYKGSIKASPKKLDFGSPKKFVFEAATMGTSASQQPIDFKASLLQSPARRPTSLMKTFAPSLPDKALGASETQVRALDTIQRSPLKVTRFTPHKISNTPFHATQPSTWSVQAQDTHLPLGIVENKSPLEETEIIADPYSVNEQSTTPPGSPQFAVLGAQSVFNSPKAASTEGQGVAQTLTHTMETFQTRKSDDPSSSANGELGEMTTLIESTPKISTGPWTGKNLPSAFRLNWEDPRLQAEESDSEDELQSTFKPGTLQPHSHDLNGTPTPAAFPRGPRSTLGRSSFHTSMTGANGNVSMTPLATQLSSWLAASPDKKAPRVNQGELRNISSPIGLKLFGQVPRPSQSLQQISPRKSVSPMKSSFFEEEMMVLDQEEPAVDVHEDELAFEENAMAVQASGASFESNYSTESDQYADENAVPIDPQLLQVEAEGNGELPLVVETCTPARVFYSNPREIHTVSKVPLRPPADDTPDLFPRKRSQSLSSPTRFRGIFKDMTRLSYSAGESNVSEPPEMAVLAVTDVDHTLTPQKLCEASAAEIPLPVTPSGGTWSAFTTPGHSARKDADAQILRGAVVYVDVHTTEGADASAIFVELLTSMGARCVKQWNWNPRASLGGSLDALTDGQEPVSGTPCNKVGITHVVFKDGGKRTLEKVRESNGLVSCVGVGWVLE